MHWGVPGTINSNVSSTGITVMAATQKKPATSKAEDDTWDAIFDSLTIENEPPIEYIRNVIIYTKDGSYIKVSAKNFAEIIEHEKHLGPEHSEIKSCRMNINFPKLRADVDAWTSDVLGRLDGNISAASPKARKTVKRKPVAAKTKAKSKSKKPSKTSKTKR